MYWDGLKPKNVNQHVTYNLTHFEKSSINKDLTSKYLNISFDEKIYLSFNIKASQNQKIVFYVEFTFLKPVVNKIR